MKTEKIEFVVLTAERVVRLLERSKVALRGEDYEDLENLVKSFAYVTELLKKKSTSIRMLRKLLFGFQSEKLSKVLKKLEEKEDQEERPSEPKEEPKAAEGEKGAEASQASGGESAAQGDEKCAQGTEEPEEKIKGHGRAGADAYEGAEKLHVGHSSLKPGDACPEEGCEGRVYDFTPRKLVRIQGQAPVAATVVEVEQLRCNLCLKIFTAELPPEVGLEKYDETAASMIAILRYGTGVPFYRLQGLQKGFKIPLPASTQWDVVERAAKKILPAYKALIGEAAQGDVLYNDDTKMKILSLMIEKDRRSEAG